ncbi:MAG: glycosyltransferase [Piscinibacter sp.]|nr:glycosyltransferase [Piscinibacter sp.]
MSPLPRVGFVLASGSDAPLPSTRISVLNMLPFLREAGYSAEIAHAPDRESHQPDLNDLDPRSLASRYDIVYFQKVRGPSVVQLVRRLETDGVRTVYGMCDLVEPEMVAATSATAVVTDYLRQLHPPSLRHKMHVVHDGIERPERHRVRPSDHRGSAGQPLRAVLVTSASLTALPVIGRPPSWLSVTVVGAYPVPAWRGRRLRWLRGQLAQAADGQKLATVSSLLDRRIERVAWDPIGVYDQLERADIGIIPVNTNGPAYWKVKSENRLTLKMAAALPVIATPVPAYETVVVPGENAFFANCRDEWMSRLEALRDPALRLSMGTRAREAVLPRFSKEAQAQALISVLQAALEPATADAAR